MGDLVVMIASIYASLGLAAIGIVCMVISSCIRGLNADNTWLSISAFVTIASLLYLAMIYVNIRIADLRVRLRWL